MKEQYPEVDIRPHCAKIIPGDAYWNKKKKLKGGLQWCVGSTRHHLLESPDLAGICQDFKAKPSVVSHGHDVIQKAVATQFDELNIVAEKEHEAINPPNVHGTAEENAAIMESNRGKYDY
mgnify:CR=1 FL=1